MLSQQRCLLLEKLFANLQRNGVDDGLSLTPLQACHHNFKLRSVQHKRDLRNLWLGHRDLHKLLHGSKTVQHAIVNIDINHVSTVFYLLLGNVHSRRIVSCHHQLLEFQRTCNVTPFSYIQERETKMVVDIVYNKILKPRKPHLRTANIRKLARLVSCCHRRDSLDMRRSGSTASSNHVQPSILKEYFVLYRHILWGLIITSHCVRKTSIRVHMNKTFNTLRKPLDKRNHMVGSQGTVQPNTHRFRMPNRCVKGLAGLAR